VPQNIHVAYLGARPGASPGVLRTAAAGNGGCCEVCCDRCREEGYDVGKSVL